MNHRKLYPSLILALLGTALAGCYGSTPPPPPTIVPPRSVAGERIKVSVHSEMAMENRQKVIPHCPQGHAPGSPACTNTYTTETVPVTHTTGTATYAGRPLTLAQLWVMSNPEEKKKTYDLIEADRAACEGANTPRIAGTALMLGGAAAMVISVIAQKSDVAKPIAIGGGVAFGGGIGSYGLGYFAFGGKRCNDADARIRSIPSTTETSVHDREEADRMRKLGDEYNAKAP